jgi:hypothetical protein
VLSPLGEVLPDGHAGPVQTGRPDAAGFDVGDGSLVNSTKVPERA